VAPGPQHQPDLVESFPADTKISKGKKCVVWHSEGGGGMEGIIALDLLYSGEESDK